MPAICIKVPAEAKRGSQTPLPQAGITGNCKLLDGGTGAEFRGAFKLEAISPDIQFLFSSRLSYELRLT